MSRDEKVAFVLFHGDQSSFVPVYAILLSVGYFAATNMPIAVNRIGVRVVRWFLPVFVVYRVGRHCCLVGWLSGFLLWAMP